MTGIDYDTSFLGRAKCSTSDAIQYTQVLQVFKCSVVNAMPLAGGTDGAQYSDTIYLSLKPSSYDLLPGAPYVHLGILMPPSAVVDKIIKPPTTKALGPRRIDEL